MDVPIKNFESKNPCCAFGDTRWSLEYLSNNSYDIDEFITSCQVKIEGATLLSNCEI